MDNTTTAAEPTPFFTGEPGAARSKPATPDALGGHQTIWFEPTGPIDFREALRLDPGATVPLELEPEPGCLDPLRVVEDPQAAVALAAEMLATADDWGDVIPGSVGEDDLAAAIQYGLETGATTTYTALTAAEKDGTLHGGTVDALFEVIGKNPLASAVFGSPART